MKPITYLSIIAIAIGLIFLANGLILAVWAPPTAPPPGDNVDRPINVSDTDQSKLGGFGIGGGTGQALQWFRNIGGTLHLQNEAGTSNLVVGQDGKVGIGTTAPTQKLDVAGYIKGQSGICIGNNCREGWPDAPLSNLNRFVAGHEYPYGTDPYLRDEAYPYPYLTLANAIDLFGIDPDNEYATNWFRIAYSYWQPYRQYRSALFINEGDNSSPRNLYRKYDPDWDRNNPNDTFAYGGFVDKNGVARVSGSESFIDACIAQPGYENCDYVVSKTYIDSTSNLKGQVFLQIRLKAGQHTELCTQDYLPGMTLATHGNPKVTNFRINSYQLPDIEGDICYGANIHSKIEARFIVMERFGLGPDPLINFYNAGENFTYMIKSLGIAYLTWIQ